MSDLEKQLEKEIAQLRSEREIYDTLWQECAEVVQPHKQIETKTNFPGRTDIEETLEITAQQSNQTLAAGQMAHIVPMGQRWFALAPPPELVRDNAAVRYYAAVTEAIHNYLASSNFYGEIHEQFLDRGCFGTAAINIRAGRDDRGLHFESLTPGSFSILEDSYGHICNIARDYTLTAQQAAQMFGEDDLPPPLKKAKDKGSFEKFNFVHYIRPNPDHNPESIFSFRYESHHLFMGQKKTLLRSAGYHEMPTACSRWVRWGQSPYGISPTMFALPASRQANYLETLGDLLGELSAFPRSLVPSTLKGEIDYRPNGVTVFDASMGAAEMPREWLTQGRYDVLLDRLNHKIEQIRAAYHVPLFELITQREKTMTATEVQQRVNEKASLFHPIFVRAVTELLTPIILRSYAILAQQPGALPTPPPSVIRSGNGAFIPDPEVSFVSPLALAMQQNQFSALPSVLEMVGMAAQFDPSAADSFSAAELFPALARAHNLPEVLIRTPEEIAERREAAAQAQQAQQMQAMASSAKDLGAAIGNVGGPGAAEQLMTVEQ
jgi:hypothetical protein